MKKSQFNFSNLRKAVKGQKVSNDIRPEIMTGTAINKFTMNGSASQIIGLADGDYLMLFENPDATGMDDKYFVAKTVSDEGAKVASAQHSKGTGRPLTFNFSGIWSKMLQCEVDALTLGMDALVEKGLMKEVETQKNKEGVMLTATLAVQRVGYLVERIEDEDGAAVELSMGDTVYPEFFALKAPRIVPVEKGSEGEDVGEAEEVL